MIGHTLGWLGRTFVLILSMVATLSIIGSIAAIPSGSVETRPGPPPPRRFTPPPLPVAEPAPRPAVSGSEAAGSASGPLRERTGGPLALPPPDPLRWLKPLTYGVIALAGLMVIAVLLLWRVVTLLALRR